MPDLADDAPQQQHQPYLQRDQPAGVPPLALTGERTLPDVPEENYWFARHLVVYEWIAAQVGGLRVVDMACGEGYGSDVLARAGAAEVVGVDANSEAHEHARLRYVRDNLRFVRTMVETFDEPCDALVFLQTIEHVQDPGAVLARFRELVGPGGLVIVSTPNVLTLAPPGADRRARAGATTRGAALPGGRGLSDPGLENPDHAGATIGCRDSWPILRSSTSSAASRRACRRWR